MTNTIKLKRGTSTPSTSDISSGEVAIDTSAKKLYINDSGTVKEIGGAGTIGGSTGIDFNDDVKVRFGTGHDLEIFHDSTHSALKNNTGTLHLSSQRVKLTNTAAGHTFLDANVSSSVDLYFNNSKKFATSSVGATISGEADITGGVLRLGTANTSSGHLNAYENMTFNIDTDNDDTNRTFKFLYNGASGTGTELFKLEESGQATIPGNLDVGAGLDVTGNIGVSGTVDGRDIASDGSKLDGIESGATADQTKSDIDALGIAASTASTLATARTIAGASFDGSANVNISYADLTNKLSVGDGGLTQNNFTNTLKSKLDGIASSATNVTNNNQLTNGAGYITATLTEEQVEDYVGGMVTGNTETGITVTYQDSDGTLDFAVASQTDNNFTTTLKNKLDGIASSATNVTNNNQLTNGAGYITSSGTSASCSGNAATATTLATARTIGGVSFDGSANINLPGVNATGSQNTTGTAAQADVLSTSRTIAGTSFNGSANIDISYTDLTNKLSVGDGGLTQNNFTNTLKSKLDGIASSATNVTNNNQLTNGAGYITATLTEEQVEDYVGGMVTGNTETGITVTYQDSDGTLDFAVASQTDNNFTTTLKNKLDGIASGATNVTNNNQLTNGAGYITSTLNGSTFFIKNQGGDCHMEIGSTANSNQNAYIDLIGDTTYADYGLRLLRGNDGANGTSVILHRGTGYFKIGSQDGGKVCFGGYNDGYAFDNVSYAAVQIVSSGVASLAVRANGTGGQTAVSFFNPNGRVGYIGTSGTSTGYHTSSDYRLKENAVAISDGITRLKTLKPYRFNFKSDPDVTVDGFFAHEVTAVPEAITGTKDETHDLTYVESDDIPEGKEVGDVKEANAPLYQCIDQSKIVPLLTAALQEAINKIEILETKVAALESS